LKVHIRRLAEYLSEGGRQLVEGELSRMVVQKKTGQAVMMSTSNPWLCKRSTALLEPSEGPEYGVCDVGLKKILGGGQENGLQCKW